MSDPQGILFYPTPTVIGIGLVALVGSAALCWTAWRRSGYRRSIGWLELFRWILIALVGITLCQPEWLATAPSEQRSTLVALWDRSGSMQTEDVFVGNAANAQPISRLEAIQPLLDSSEWSAGGESGDSTLFQGLDIVFESFASDLEPTESGTDLNSALTEILERQSNLRGVVVISDGDWNTGVAPMQAATQYRMQDVPLFAIGVGSESPQPDIELVSLDVPTFAIAKKPIQIPYQIRSSLGRDRNVTVTLSIDDQIAQTQVVRIPAVGQAQANMTWVPSAVGAFDLKLSISQDPLDRISRNNELTTPIEVRQEQIKVLLVESYPRWEYRYLRNALERDPGVEVNCLLLHPDILQKGGGRGYIKSFPTANELSRYDVVFLGDIGIAEKQLTLEQAQDLRQLVSAQAAGLVFLPGRYGFQETLNHGPLADLYPIIPDSVNPTGKGSAQPGHFAMTRTGQRSLLTRLAEGDQANSGVWNKLPGFHWYAAVERAKLGSEVLAVHDQETNESGRIPLIVTKTFGAGKCLFMGADSAWRWREGVEDQYHYRFWGQVARWMAYQRQKSEGNSMRLFISPDRPEVGDVVNFNANVLDAFGGFLEEDTVLTQTVAPSGAQQSIRLQPGADDAVGLFSGSFIPKESGLYKITATSEETGSTLQMDLVVQGKSLEAIGKVARLDVLEEITQMTGGKMFRISQAQDLLEDLAQLPEPDPVVHRTRIWANSYWGGVLVFLLGLFWTARKWAGEV